MKPHRISKAVAKVLDELWPIGVKAHRDSGNYVRFSNWREAFKSKEYNQKWTWNAVAKWHLKQLKLAAKSKEGK